VEAKGVIGINSETLLLPAGTNSSPTKRASMNIIPSSSSSLYMWRNRMVGFQRAIFLTLINNSDASLDLESSNLGVGSFWGQQVS
jgi:hypothetical protein